MTAAAAFARETSTLVKRSGLRERLTASTWRAALTMSGRSARAHLIEEVTQDPQIFVDVAGLMGEAGVWPGA
jgi:hypothetical protein